MPEITNKGRELALQIAPVTGTTRAMQETCSLICRHTRTYHRIQEDNCNGYATPSGDWDERAAERAEVRERRLESRIAGLAAQLPEWDEDGQRGSFGVKFSGDPRGCVVKLTGPRSRYDDWGGEGICVPR